MICKFNLREETSTFCGESTKSRKHVENYSKYGRQKPKMRISKVNIKRRARTHRYHNETEPCTSTRPHLPTLTECEKETTKVEDVVKETKTARWNSAESWDKQLTETIEVAQKIPLFAENKKCTVSSQQTVSTHVELERPSLEIQRQATNKKTLTKSKYCEIYCTPSRRVTEDKPFYVGKNSKVEREIDENRSKVFLVLLITIISKLTLMERVFASEKISDVLNSVNKCRYLCSRIRNLLCTKFFQSKLVTKNKEINHIEGNCPQYYIRSTSHMGPEHRSRPKSESPDALQTERGVAGPFCATASGALRPVRTRPLLGLTWCLVLLLSCTGSLVSVRELHDTLNWAPKDQQDLKKPSSSKGVSVGAQAAIIPPAWANITVNPCALESWQLLYWPQHDKCYKIFSQGPCAAGEEVYHDHGSGAARCRCEKGRIRHMGRCHVAYTRGPCKPREYLVEPPQGEEAQCQPFVSCATGDVFWPQDGLCYRQFTQGPCQHGDLVHLHPDSGWPTCGCDSSLMRMQYWQHANTCHELLTRGPCVTGHVYTYNRTTRTTECGCGPYLTSNYHRETAQCYPLDTQGPCPDGHTFSLPTGATEPMCTCLSGHLLHVASGTCQRAYTRAVCTAGHFLKPDPSASVGVGRCTPVPCSNTGQLYHPETDSCYPVGSSGPCSKGKLWVYERASSFRGRCHCDDKLVGYWGPHDICYPLGEKGPCPSRHVVTYSPTKGLACSCDRRRGYSRWKGRCERITAADIIRDLISRNLMAPAQDSEHHLSNSVMHSKGRSLREETAVRLTTRARFMRTTQNAPSPTPTTPLPTQGSIIEEDTTATDGDSVTRHRVDTHEIITFSRGSANSIEEPTGPQQSQRLQEEADISTRIARLTHRGLITRRARRLPPSSQ